MASPSSIHLAKPRTLNRKSPPDSDRHPPYMVACLPKPPPMTARLRLRPYIRTLNEASPRSLMESPIDARSVDLRNRGSVVYAGVNRSVLPDLPSRHDCPSNRWNELLTHDSLCALAEGNYYARLPSAGHRAGTLYRAPGAPRRCGHSVGQCLPAAFWFLSPQQAFQPTIPVASTRRSVTSDHRSRAWTAASRKYTPPLQEQQVGPRWTLPGTKTQPGRSCRPLSNCRVADGGHQGAGRERANAGVAAVSTSRPARDATAEFASQFIHLPIQGFKMFSQAQQQPTEYPGRSFSPSSRIAGGYWAI